MSVCIPGVAVASEPPPPPVVEFTPLDPVITPLDVDTGPSFAGTKVLAPTAQHGWLAIGDYAASPSLPTVQAVFTTGGAGQPWALVAAGDVTAGAAISHDVATTPGGSEVIVGYLETDRGTRPTYWVFDGDTLSKPRFIGNKQGWIDMIEIGPDGTWYLQVIEIAEREDAVSTSASYRRRLPDGTWKPLRIEPPHGDFWADGMAVRGSTLVLTGDTDWNPRAFVSIDGQPARLADVSDLPSGGYLRLGAAEAGPDGFYAAVCTTGGDAQSFQYAFSADGATWKQRQFVSELDGLDVERCGSIGTDSDGGVWLTSGHDEPSTTFYRVRSGRIVEWYRLDHPAGIEFDGQVFAVDGTQLGFLGATQGGAVAGVVERSGTPTEVTEITGSGGVPGFREQLSHGDRLSLDGRLIAVYTFPQVTETERGRWWGPRLFPLRVSNAATLEPAPANAVPGGPGSENTDVLIASVPGQRVAVVHRVDPLDSLPDGYVGPIGNTWVQRRPTDATWAPKALLAGGPGSQQIWGLVRVGDVLVGAGDNTVGAPDPSTLPLLVTIDAESSGEIEAPHTGGGFHDVCRVGPNGAVAFGEAATANRSSWRSTCQLARRRSSRPADSTARSSRASRRATASSSRPATTGCC